MSAQPKTPEQITEVADNLAKVQSFDPWAAKWISEAHMLLRSLASKPAEQPRGEPVAYWAAIDAEGYIIHAYNADDGNGGEAARQEMNDWINGRLNDGGPLLRLVALYLVQPKPEQVKCGTCGEVIRPDAMTGTTCACAKSEQAVGDGVLSGKYGDVLRPFLALMDRELHANAGKGDRPGWLAMDRKTALLEIFYHLAKLQKATKDDDQERIREYGADVANMAMMLVDVCGALDVTPRPTIATPAEVTNILRELRLMVSASHDLADTRSDCDVARFMRENGGALVAALTAQCQVRKDGGVEGSDDLCVAKE